MNPANDKVRADPARRGAAVAFALQMQVIVLVVGARTDLDAARSAASLLGIASLTILFLRYGIRPQRTMWSLIAATVVLDPTAGIAAAGPLVRWALR